MQSTIKKNPKTQKTTKKRVNFRKKKKSHVFNVFQVTMWDNV